MILPGVGTVVGGLVGGIAAGLAGGAIGNKAARKVYDLNLKRKCGRLFQLFENLPSLFGIYNSFC